MAAANGRELDSMANAASVGLVKTFLLWTLGAAAAGGAAPLILVGIGLLAESKLAPIETAMTAERRVEVARIPALRRPSGSETATLPAPETEAPAEIVLHPSGRTSK